MVMQGAERAVLSPLSMKVEKCISGLQGNGDSDSFRESLSIKVEKCVSGLGKPFFF